MKAAIALFTIATFLSGNLVVQVQAAVCPVCHHDPCTCGSGSGKHDRTRVGVGVSVDLGGVGKRKAEADPFAVPSESTSSSSRSSEKKTKNPASDVAKEPAGYGNAFSYIKMTGPKTKLVNVADAGQAAKPQ